MYEWYGDLTIDTMNRIWCGQHRIVNKELLLIVSARNIDIGDNQHYDQIEYIHSSMIDPLFKQINIKIVECGSDHVNLSIW